MQPIRHYPMPDVDDRDDGLDTDEALLFGAKQTGHERPMSSTSRMLAGGIVLAIALVTGAYIIVSLAKMGWRLLPW